MHKLAVFDVGGTNIKFEFLVDKKTITNSSFEVRGRNKAHVLEEIAKLINEFANGEHVDVRISSPTAVNTSTGFCKGLSGIKGYANFNLYEELGKLIAAPYTIKAMNDANSALLGIVNTKFENKPNSALMISLGTGIGGALYIDGKIFAGHDGMAGEIGYPIWRGEKNISLSLSPVHFIESLNTNLNGKEVFDLYLTDKKVTEAINEWLFDLSRAISLFAFTVNPEVILFTGAVSKNKTFQMVLSSIYADFLKKHDLDILTTKLLFFEDDINYNLEGAKIL